MMAIASAAGIIFLLCASSSAQTLDCGQLLALSWSAHAGIGERLRLAEISAGAARSIPELGHPRQESNAAMG
jgi:hypothetical protein